jgi:hypothetical protein
MKAKGGGGIMKNSLKTAIVLVILLALSAVGASAKSKGGLRLGLEFGNPSAVLIIRPAPFDFKVGYNFAGNEYLFLSADYRIISGYQLVDVLHFFLGVGAYTLIQFDSSDFNLGARIPVGLQVFLVDNVVELFLEIVPTVGFVPALEAFPEWQGYIGFTILVR